MILKNINAFTKTLILSSFLLAGRVFAYDKPVRIVATPALENDPNATIPYFVTTSNNNTQMVQLSAPGSSYDKTVTGMVKLIVKTNSPFYIAPYDAEVDVQISTYDVASNLINTTLKTLKVKHQPFQNSSYKDQDYIIFNQSPTVYKIVTTVMQIKIGANYVTTLPNNLLIESSIDYLRYDPFNAAAATSIPGPINISPQSLDGNPNDMEVLNVSWPSVAGAVYYELQYTSVNDYTNVANSFNMSASADPLDLQYDFKNNSTSIITNGLTYDIPNIFERGYFLCRVRAYGKDISGTNPSLKAYYGNWTCNTDADNVYNYSQNCANGGLYAVPDHFQIDLNWQYNATFAEDAKRKDVINFADGSLRSRQTITKLNSNNTTVVGENVYDYNGRVAISILPSPLHPTINATNSSEGTWSFGYKPSLNRSDATNAKYSKEDFDFDPPPSNDPCSPPVATGMKDNSGASQYYSPTNPDQTGHQAYVPDANKFPFTQTEFTPDNTGRIKKQGGVGPNHQIGTDRETKYFYGTPEQIELDRLFGSEVGDGSHYQKNMVMDANGQISITYMDMEGKTIATCLAGDPPPNMVNLPKQPATASQLVSDMFNKDPDNVSENNIVDADGETIVFTKSILISEAGALNTFNYNMSIANYQDACLVNGVCFNCVYDFEFTITDDCGQQIYPAANAPLKKMIGRFNLVNNEAQFTTSCYNPATYNYQELPAATTPIAFPKVGVYYINKKLSINHDARDFYLKKYLDKNYNSCIKDLADIKAEMPQPDSNDCKVSCAKCFQSIGKKDEYVSKGKGTEEEWQTAYDECREKCGYPKSSCEIALAQLMGDMSPNGQYGNVTDLTDKLSIYNQGNLLPKNIAGIAPGPVPNNVSNNINNGPVIPTGLSYWKKPLHYKTNQPYYYDKKGKIYKVMLTKTPTSTFPGQYNLHVSQTLQVFPTNTVGVFWTYPQNLFELSDFLSIWQPSFAKSLITYHPEFCYYKDCEDVFNKKQGLDTLSSNDFDMRLLYTKDFVTALNRFLLIPNGNGGFKLNLAMDPANASNYYAPYANGSPLITKYNTFQTLSNNNSMTMDEFASYTHKCATQFASNQTSNSSCTNFCFPISNATSAQITAMQDQEWNTLKAIYYSEKQKLLYKYQNAKRLVSPLCNYYNACIGVPDFDGYNTPMVKYDNQNPPMPLATSPYFNCKQPCNQAIKDLYADKQKRFGHAEDAESQVLDENEVAYQMFLQTGRCPMAQDLMDLSNALAVASKFASPNEALQNYPAMTVNFYNYLNNVSPPPTPYVVYQWKASAVGNNLNVNFVKAINNSIVKFVKFIQPSNQMQVVWSNVKAVSQLQHTGFNGPNSTFSCTVKELVNNTIVLKYITGETDIAISGCTFKNICKPNDLAKQLQTVMNTLASNNNFNSATPVALGQPAVNTPLGPYLFKLQQLIGQSATTPNFNWVQVSASPPAYEVYDNSTPNCKLRLNFLTLNNGPINSSNPITLNAFNSIKVFTKIKSDYQNFFVMEARDINNVFLGIVRGEAFKICGGPQTPVTMGTCELPDPASCKTPYHKNLKDLEGLLKDILEGQKYLPIASANVANVASNINLTNNLLTNFQPLAPNIPASVQSVVDANYQTFYQGFEAISPSTPNDVLTFTLISPCVDIIAPPDDDDDDNQNLTAFAIEPPPCVQTEYCKVSLKTNNKTSTTNHLLSNLVKVHKLMGYGPINNNNYTNFIIVADFNVNNTIEKDTIYGTSCYELQNCIPCQEGPNNCCAETFTMVSEDPIFSNPMPDPIFKDSLAVANNQAYPDTTLAAYTLYRSEIQSLNANMGWASSDPNYVTPLSLKELKVKGYFKVKSNYSKFIQNFDSTLDNHIYLCNMAKFVLDHGATPRPQRCYERFLKAHQNYNTAALAQSQPTITPMADTTFYTSNLLDSVNVYIDYLNNAAISSTVPLQPDSFFAGRANIPPSNVPQPCQDLYNAYVITWTQYMSDPNNIANCWPSPNQPLQLYTLNEFVGWGYCCAPGYTAWTNYINSFYNTTGCPKEIREEIPCNAYTPPSESECDDRYLIYTNTIAAYNASSYATLNNAYLSANLFSSPQSFYQLGYCECVLAYIAYLNTYINNAPINAAPPVSINIWPGCGTDQPPGGCPKVYDDYVAATDDYVNWLSNVINPTQYPIPIVYDYGFFVSAGYCNCAEGYIGFLKGIVNGAITDINYIQNNFSLGMFCAQVTYTCPSKNTLETYETPPVPSSENPCIKYQKDLFEANAKAKYEQYLKDQTAIFIKKYNAYCLGATESLVRTYFSKEFHYTLYYYDQAGNLIKTIPPEGLDVTHYLSINSYLSPNAVKAKNDRKFKTKTLFTDHGMATTYQYNSLNQLVKQKMPDHDALKYIKFQGTDGIDPKVTVVSSQFPDANKGYIAVDEDLPNVTYFNNITRGKVFESTDGSLSWSPAKNIMGADINKIQFLKVGNKDYGLAVGNDGTFAFSTDGGANWDYYPVHEYTNDNSNLNDLVFYINATNQLEGMLVGDNGTIIKVVINTGGSASISLFNQLPASTSFGSNDNITDITLDAGNTNNYFITVLDKTANTSKIYRSNGVANWQDITEIKLPSLAKVRMIKSTQFYYAVGEDGDLITSLDEGNTWKLVETNNYNNFRDVYFATPLIGVALIDDASNVGGLYKTIDGGKNWTLMDQPTGPDTYLTLSPFENPGSATIHKLTANGTSGLVKRVTIDFTNANSPGIGAVNTSISGAGFVNDVCVVPYDVVNSSNFKLYALAVGTNGEINFCTDYNQNTPTWVNMGNALGAVVLKKSLVNIIQQSTLPELEAFALTTAGVLHRIECPDISATLPAYNVHSLPYLSNYTCKDMVYDFNNLNYPYGTAYMIGDQSGNITFAHHSLFNLSSGPNLQVQGPSLQNNSSPVSLVVDGKNGASNQQYMLAVGSTARIIKHEYVDITTNANSTSQFDNSLKIIPVKINDVVYSGVAASNNFLVTLVGEDGFFAQKNLTGNNPFEVKETKTSSDFTSVKCSIQNNFEVFYTTTKQGQAGKTVFNLPPVLTQVSTFPLNDVAFKNIGNVDKLYYVGDNAEAYYFDGTLYSQVGVNGSDHLNTVAFCTQNNNVTAAGNGNSAFNFFATSALPNKNWHTNQINKLHFTDADNGYIVGMKGLVRHTSDGGATWKTAKPPYENFNNKPVDLYAVYTTTLNKAIIGGNYNYVGNVDNVTIANAALSTLVNQANRIWYDIDFYSATDGFIVGGQGNTLAKAGNLTINPNNTITFTEFTNIPNTVNNFRSVYACRGIHQGKFIAVGGNQTFGFWNGTSFPIVQYPATQLTAVFPNASDIIYDIAMSDNNDGYIVGSNTRMASISFNYATPSASLTQIVTAPLYATQSANHIMTASLINDVDGFIGGYTGNAVFNPNNLNYAWKFTHEKGKTSTLFWYDRLGRMVLSQNSKQINKTPKAYSYTRYDAKGRIIEVGEKSDNTAPNMDIQSIFGDYVGNYYNPNVISDSKYFNWVLDNSGQRREVTTTYYDNNVFFVAPACSILVSFNQENLQNRVANVTYEDVWDGDPCKYDHATHYSYDIHGNVKSVLQDNFKATMPANNPLNPHRYKRIDYDYDLISGKVNMVSYQAGMADQFYHQYEYDDDNRIVEVKTSRNGIQYETDAKYFYYKHGPLARVEYGHDKVQGMDYAYTLQGWIKGMNNDALNVNNDIGKDGKIVALNTNSIFAQDAAGYSLGYFNGDYNAINTTQWNAANRFEANKSGSALLASASNLFNGNIGIMNTSIVQPLNLNAALPNTHVQQALPAANSYGYDQLNRIAVATNFNNLNLSTNSWEATAPANPFAYKNTFEYDDNGNITKQKKYDKTGVLTDDLEYYYNKSGSATGKLKQNRLYGIRDITGSTALLDGDIETPASAAPFDFDEADIDQSSASSPYNNYRYDELGNLIYDGFEGLTTSNAIVWSVYGKIKEVNNSLPGRKSLKFDYDAMGNRVAKHVYAGSNLENSTYYVRDAQGNVMATYTSGVICVLNCQTSNPIYGLSFKLTERPIYGSSRVGLDVHTLELDATSSYNFQAYERMAGDKQFEMSNHLGNVIGVVSDRKIPIPDIANTSSERYIAQVMSSTDYYAFGESMDGRRFNNDKYRYGFNGKENDPETVGTGQGTQDYGLRIYNPALGRFLSIDPLAKSYPYKTTYDFAENDVIRATDLDGAEKNINTLNLPVRSKYMGVPNQDFGFGNSNAPTAAANGGYMEGITPNLPVKYYFNPNAMDGSSTSGHYFYQNPMPRTVTTSNTQMPPAVAQPPQNNNIQANVGFVANQPALTVAGQAQVNAIAQQIQNTVNQNTGPVATQVQTQPIQNSEGLPGTVTTVTQNQPIQIVTVTSNVTISLATSMQANNPNAAPLLQQRYNNIRAQLINQGVPAANISMAPLGPQSFGLQGAPNQTTFNIQTNTTTQNGTQTTTTTTTKDYTYGE